MARAQQINHKGKTIFHMDFTNLVNVNDIKGVIADGAKFIRNQPQGSVLTLTDLNGMHFSNEIKDLFSDFIKGNKPYVKAGAVVGLNGLQQILYNGLMKITGRDIKSFSSVQTAKDWLAERN